MATDSAPAHTDLGLALSEQGLTDEAIESHRRAVTVDPQYAAAHYNLGNVLRKCGKLDEAIDCYRHLIEIAPREALAYRNLASALRARGDQQQALAAHRRAPELFARQDGAFARQQGDLARKQIDRIELLENILIGQQPARSHEDWVSAIDSAYRQRRNREIVVLTERTLQATPALVGDEDGGTYDCACAAALLAADPAEPGAERARVRELARWTGRVQQGGEPATDARGRLAHALRDPDFASVRDQGPATLPAAERQAWQELWQAIERAATENCR